MAVKERACRRAAVVAAACAMALVLAASAAGAAPLRLGFADPLLSSADAGVRGTTLTRAGRAGGELVRIGVSWARVSPRRPADGSSPLDPTYEFSALDQVVRDAVAAGQEPILTVSTSPRWAEGRKRPSRTRAPAGTWKPSPKALGEFAAALARRYSGSFAAPGGVLPRVRLFQAWVEPNLSTHLTPQYRGGKSLAPGHYLRMLNAFSKGSGVAGGAKPEVITAGLAPYGNDPGGDRTRPLAFWRKALCLKGRRALRARGCGKTPRARFDILAHHPINTSGPPRQSALHPDDVSSPDLPALRRVLRAAERHKRVTGGGRHPLWVTEFWWESNPPDRRNGSPLKVQARYIEESLYLFWKAGARVAINLQVSDPHRSDPLSQLATGVYFRDGKPKPARLAFRFPFVAERAKKRSVRLWGKAPRNGRVVIERRAKRGWRRVAATFAKGSRVFTARARIRGAAKLRACFAGRCSVTWRLGSG